MLSDARLVRVGSFELRLRHLLIIGVLAAAFSITFMIRSQPINYGYELNEFDPFYNYRATQFLVDNGLEEYLDWHDYMSWYPKGRNISGGSQMMLHVTAASTYTVFGGGSDLYDHLIIFPVIFGSMTAIIVFAMVRVIGGTTAGLIASLLFAVSAPVIVRGTLGWFKSEPLGLFYGLLGLYLFLSGVTTNSKKIAILKMAGAGIFLAFSISSWGGMQFLIMPIGFFILLLPILRRDHGTVLFSVPVFAAAFILTLINFERPGLGFVIGFGGALLIGPTAYMIASIFLQRASAETKRIRNSLMLLGGIIAGGAVLLAANEALNLLKVPSFRYLNAVNPFLTTTDPLTDSVSEHATTTLSQSFFFLSILMVFAGIGAWLLFGGAARMRRYKLGIRLDMAVFALMLGILGAYISSAFIRLELFASISVIVLASIGIAVMASEIFKRHEEGRHAPRPPSKPLTISFVAVIVGLLLVPAILPEQQNWTNVADSPPSILNGGTQYRIAVQDWPDALEWLRTNTPPDSVVASWWDYGYWITTVGERTSLADNGTIDSKRIQEIARMLMASPDEAWQILQGMDADYVLIFLAASKIQTDPAPLYVLSGGGDESKKQWFVRIAAEEPLDTYFYADGQSGKPYFWESTLLGQMMPYTQLVFVNSGGQQSPVFQPGYTAVYEQDIKYPADGDGPLRLAYASDTFYRESTGPITAILIYEVNKNYTS